MILHLGDGPLIFLADLDDCIWLQGDLVVMPGVVEGLSPNAQPQLKVITQNSENTTIAEPDIEFLCILNGAESDISGCCHCPWQNICTAFHNAGCLHRSTATVRECLLGVSVKYCWAAPSQLSCS